MKKAPLVPSIVSHYRILEKLGEGGMGVVYKARDTKLDRLVALKFLPPHLNASEQDEALFLQEARAAAALNHPHICTIHGVEEDAGRMFIVMEFIEGGTLREKIPYARVDDAIGVAIQIGEALQDAHASGIVHRDIKPDNIMLTSKGQAKVMDFGLAKLKEPLTSSRASSTVGTIAYMSPEQIQGGESDARGDIFSFGAMLFEMLTGKTPFRGEHEAAMIYSIINEDPQPIQKYRDDISMELCHILDRALAKDPRGRYQTAKEMTNDLRRVKNDPTTVVQASDSEKKASHRGSVFERTNVRSSPRRMWPGIGVLAGIVVLAALCYLLFAKTFAPSLPAMKTVAFTSYPGYAGAPSFSPDGNSIAFVWNGERGENLDIYVKLVDAGSPLRLTSDPAPDDDPAWSSDGRYIAFSRSVHDGTSFYVIPSLGGSERKIADVRSSGSGIDWSPDDRTLVVSASESPGEPNSIMLISVETGQKQKLTSPDVNGQGEHAPKFSPDGTQIAYAKSLSSGVVELYTIPSTGGREKRLTFDNLFVGSDAWTVDGREILFSSNRGGNTTLWRIPAQGGVPVAVPSSGENVQGIAIGKKGNNLAYGRLIENTNIWQLNLGMSAAVRRSPTELISSRQKQMGPAYSNDGKHIAFVSDRSGSFEIWVCQSDGTDPVQLTFFRGPQVGCPRWSPDDRFMLFDSREKGNGNIYVVNSNGGTPRQLTSGKSENNVPSWSRDGRWIYFSSNRTGVFQMYKISAEGGREIQITTKGGFAAFESHDGKYLYYAEKNNQSRIMRAPLAGGEAQSVDTHLSDLLWCMWKLTDKGIYFIKQDTVKQGQICFYNFSTQQTRQIAVTEKSIYPYSGIDVSPDGQSLLYSQVDRIESDIMLMQNFH
jgi:Tol biopolymer transport system component/tRNA A-37 threonylcarbamoyl transferase component Bud32